MDKRAKRSSGDAALLECREKFVHGLPGRGRVIDAGVSAACALIAALGVTLSPAALAAQGEAGRGALRPFVHVLLAYAVAWIAILIWVWLIARRLRRLEDTGG